MDDHNVFFFGGVFTTIFIMLVLWFLSYAVSSKHHIVHCVDTKTDQVTLYTKDFAHIPFDETLKDGVRCIYTLIDK